MQFNTKNYAVLSKYVTDYNFSASLGSLILSRTRDRFHNPCEHKTPEKTNLYPNIQNQIHLAQLERTEC